MEARTGLLLNANRSLYNIWSRAVGFSDWIQSKDAYEADARRMATELSSTLTNEGGDGATMTAKVGKFGMVVYLTADFAERKFRDIKWEMSLYNVCYIQNCSNGKIPHQLISRSKAKYLPRQCMFNMSNDVTVGIVYSRVSGSCAHPTGHLVPTFGRARMSINASTSSTLAWALYR